MLARNLCKTLAVAAALAAALPAAAQSDDTSHFYGGGFGAKADVDIARLAVLYRFR